MKKILILGIGNILLADEGFGVHAVEYLKNNYDWPDNIQLLDGGTRGLLLMMDLMENDLVIILDVMHGTKAPGTTYLVENDGLNNACALRDSEHQTGIVDVLACCELAGFRPEIMIFGFEPYDYSTIQAELTPQAQKKLPEFCQKVIEELKLRKIL